MPYPIVLAAAYRATYIPCCCDAARAHLCARIFHAFCAWRRSSDVLCALRRRICVAFRLTRAQPIDNVFGWTGRFLLRFVLDHHLLPSFQHERRCPWRLAGDACWRHRRGASRFAPNRLTLRILPRGVSGALSFRGVTLRETRAYLYPKHGLLFRDISPSRSQCGVYLLTL